MSTPPPKLLAGAALIFWGVLTGNTTVGLLAAVLLEARSWLPLRWDFKRESYVRAWQISILCGALISLLAWMNGMKAGKIHTLFVWAPLIMLPLELAQRYGTAKKIPLNTFAIFSRKDPPHPGGLPTPPRTLNTGYPYIATVILATAMASRNELHHFAALAIITTSCLYAHMRHRGFRPWAWATALLLVITLSWFGQWGMFKLYNYLTGTSGSGSGRHTAANESVTSIGRLGRLKLSPKIFWRMHVNHGNTPHLLRTATYNQYSRARWSHEFNKSPNSRFDDAGYRTFSRDDTAPEGSRDIRWFTTSPPQLTQTAPITLTGEIDTKVTENPLPLPHFFLAVADLDAGADIECNALGTVRMANPDYNVIQYAVWQGDTSSTEEPPDTEPDKKNNLDLSVPPPERKALQRICTQLGLDDPTLSTRAKIRKLRHFFNTKFQYTTHLRTPPTDRKHRSTAVGHFLEHTRAGHCEYFATATALLLRTANIPTRYCVGFSVSEHDRDRDEWIMRGQHAHAWCRVWIEEPNHPSGKTTGHWEDLDLTPAAWETADIARTSSSGAPARPTKPKSTPPPPPSSPCSPSGSPSASGTPANAGHTTARKTPPSHPCTNSKNSPPKKSAPDPPAPHSAPGSTASSCSQTTHTPTTSSTPPPLSTPKSASTPTPHPSNNKPTSKPSAPP